MARDEAREFFYIYCIIETSKAQSFGSIGIGERLDEVYLVIYKDIAAVVSRTPTRVHQLASENVFSHEKATEKAMELFTVLPVRFNTVTESEAEIKFILEKEYDKFKGLFREMEGKKELGLKVIFKEKIIYDEIAENYEEIKKMKKKVSALSSKEAHYEYVEIGRLVEKALEKEKEKYRDEFLNCLKPLAEDIKLNKPYGERMIINAAFLVKKADEKEFDQKVNGFSEKYASKMSFKYVGTLPPFNFVNLVIETGRYREESKEEKVKRA